MTTTENAHTDRAEDWSEKPEILGQPRKPRGDLQPILAGWMKSRTEFVDTAVRAGQRGGHRTLWHLVRLPIYLVRLIGYSPRGLVRTIKAVFDVLTDAELRPLRQDAVTSGDAQTAMKLRAERNVRIHKRLLVGAILSGLLLVGCLILYFLLPSWGLGTLAGGLVLILGYVGRPIGKSLVKPATTLSGNQGPLRAPHVMEALVSLRIGGMNKVEQISLLMDVARYGPGYQVDLELPPGVTAEAVMEKRSELSAALRRELGTVWPSVGKRHQGHLVLYIADQPMTEAKQARWPLLKDGEVNVFRPAPVFTDQRGRWVDLTLAYTAGVIGAVPRMGKTFAVRELLLVAGLDARTKVYAFDLKGTGDLSPTALFAHGYSVGDEDEEIAEQLQYMRDVREEMRRRARVIRGLTHEECPENKVTDVLANRRDLRLEPIFVAVDECQCWFEHSDKATREEFIQIATDLVKRGPALGIMCYFATQKPDAKSIPTAISANASVRLCFKVNGQPANDQVLGTSSYKEGIRATLFAFADKGIAYLLGDGADAQIVRTVVGLDAPASEKVALRARQVRQAAGRLSGFAAGDVAEDEAEQVVLLDDVRHVFQGAGAMHLDEIRGGLEMLRPTLYGHLDNAALGIMLRDAGVQVGQIKVNGRNTSGVRQEWLDVSTTETFGDGGNVISMR